MGAIASSSDPVLSDRARAAHQKAEEQHLESQGHVHGGRLDILLNRVAEYPGA